MHLRRRMLVLGAVGALAPLAAFAQAGKVWRIGYLGVGSRKTAGHYYTAFAESMRHLGYVEGRNLVIEWRIADGDLGRLPAMAKALVEAKPDLIVGSSTPAIAALSRTTSTIPIVMGVSIDPVGAGFVKSLARPGGNITGTTVAWADYGAKQLELLRRLIPKLSQVGVLLNPGNPSHGSILQTLLVTGKEAGVGISAVEARSIGEVPLAVEKAVRQRVGALIVFPDGLLLQERRVIADLTIKYRLPAMYQLPENVEVGGLMSYGQDVIHNHRLAATYVDRILRGARPGDLAVERISKLELVINAKTAKALGLTIPTDVRVLADRVIE